MEEQENIRKDVIKKLSEVCCHKDSRRIARRDFIKKTVTTTAAAAGILSLEEKILLAGPGPASQDSYTTQPEVMMPKGKIGNLEISRLICGGNLISGYAHSRDLIYVSAFLRHYFTEEKIMDTWQICEKNGINTCTIYAGDKAAMNLFSRYKKERGGKMQWLSQTEPRSAQIIERTIDEVIEYEPAAIYIAGNLGDMWTFNERIDYIERFINYVKKQNIPAGIACHSIEVPIAVETAGIGVDFYMKTLHSTNYWSARKPEQTQQVVYNYSVDNYWDMAPEQTIKIMSEIKKPWIAYKVLAAGALRPSEGLNFAFENGADFACVGMFDWQVAEDVRIGSNLIEKHQTRNRPWCA